MENRHGKMEQATKDNGYMIKLLEMENSLVIKEIFMKDNGKMIKLMVLEYLIIKKQGLNMKVSGKMICNMGQVFSYIQMVIDMRECISRVENMVKEHTILMMELSTKDNG